MDAADVLSSPVALAGAAAFGAIWGSFFNVAIARVPRGLSVVSPGSHCFSCGKPVRAFDNIPVLSYFILRGRCRSCGARFSPRYMLVELLAAALSLLVWWQFVARAPDLAPGIRSARYALGFGFAGVLLVLSFIDLDTKRLPDSITLPSIAVFFLAGFGAQLVPWHERAIGAAAGYLAVRIIADGYYYLTGREGLGLGDGKLLAVVGATLGWRSLPVVVFGASLLGIAVAVPALLLARRQASAAAGPDVPPVRRTEVPFGPFLSLSALIYLFVGDVIWRAVAVLTGAE